MSTKIYSGFKINHQNFLDINNRLTKFQKEIYPKAEQIYTEKVILSATHRFDHNTIVLGKDIKFFDCFWDIEKEAIKEIKKGYRSVYDVSFEVFLIPHKDITLGIVYTLQQEFEQKFMRKKFVKDYAYWNNTDKPKNITNKEWCKRKEDWNSVLPHGKAPAEIGFTRTIIPERMMAILDWDKWIDIIPTEKERALDVASNILFNEWKSKDNNEINVNNIFKKMREFKKWKDENEEGQKALLRKYKEVLPKIVKPNVLRNK